MKKIFAVSLLTAGIGAGLMVNVPANATLLNCTSPNPTGALYQYAPGLWQAPPVGASVIMDCDTTMPVGGAATAPEQPVTQPPAPEQPMPEQPPAVGQQPVEPPPATGQQPPAPEQPVAPAPEQPVAPAPAPEQPVAPPPAPAPATTDL